MPCKTKGLILREQSIGERDKLVTILTETRGVLRAFVRGGKSVKSKNGAATGKFCYAAFSLTQSRDSFTVTEAQPLEMFFQLRDSLDKLALGEYFLELGYACAPPEEPAEEILRVLLNSLYYLCHDTYPAKQLKAVTELRLLTISGYAPNLVACAHCNTFETPTMYLDIQEGLLYCEACAPASALFPLSTGLLNALRHIEFSELRMLYAFCMDEPLLEELAYLTETCLTRRLERKFRTLDFYHSVQSL